MIYTNETCEGYCPKCQAELEDYGTLTLEDGDQCFVPVSCKCGWEGKEWYTLTYIETGWEE